MKSPIKELRISAANLLFKITDKLDFDNQTSILSVLEGKLEFLMNFVQKRNLDNEFVEHLSGAFANICLMEFL